MRHDDDAAAAAVDPFPKSPSVRQQGTKKALMSLYICNIFQPGPTLKIRLPRPIYQHVLTKIVSTLIQMIVRSILPVDLGRLLNKHVRLPICFQLKTSIVT